MARKFRISALIFAVALVLSVLFSVAFISANSSHDCTHEACPICQQLEMCEALLHTVVAAAAVAVAVCFLASIITKVAPAICNVLSTITLVSLRVKLSN